MLGARPGEAADYCGIYLIRNMVNGKVYVGQSVHIRRRWHEHKKCAKWGRKSHLYDAIRLYGAENFAHELLEECAPEEFDAREDHWMRVYDCRDPSKGYNMLPAGQRGRIMDAEARERIASKLRGRKLPADVIARIAEKARGRVHSEETKAKIAVGNSGKIVTPESKEKLAAALRTRWEGLSEEQRKAHADSRRGYVHSDEARAKMSAAQKGQPKPAGFADRCRDRLKNEAPEAKAKRLAALAVANKARWAAWRAAKEAACC